jgi:hypothetical protein
MKEKKKKENEPKGLEELLLCSHFVKETMCLARKLNENWKKKKTQVPTRILLESFLLFFLGLLFFKPDDLHSACHFSFSFVAKENGVCESRRIRKSAPKL